MAWLLLCFSTKGEDCLGGGRGVDGHIGACVPGIDLPNYLSLYQQGRLPVDRLLTHDLALEEVNQGFDRLAAGKAIRQVIHFG